MINRFNDRLHWQNIVHATLDKYLYILSTYTLPIIIGLVSLISISYWDDFYPDDTSAILTFRVFNDANANSSAQQASTILEKSPAIDHFDTKLAETPIWFAFQITQKNGNTPAIELPSRHAKSLQCWDASTFQPIGNATRTSVDGEFSKAKAGFALGLSQPLTSSSFLCKAYFIGPARLTVLQGSSSQIEASERVFHRNAGLLDGGLIVLAIFMLVTAIINRESLYILFAASLIANLRAAALSAGFDFQWLGKTIPVEMLPHIRSLTLAFNYIFVVTLFRQLFRENLDRLGFVISIRFVQWSSVAILTLAVILPYANYLPIFWATTFLTVAILLFLLGHILIATRSNVALLYGASLTITMAAGLYEIVAAAFGWKGLIGSINSVTAALSSSLLASLAVAVQIRDEHTQRIEAQKELQHNFEVMPIGLFTLDMDGFFLNANAAFMVMLGDQIIKSEKTHWGQYFDEGAWGKLLDLAHSATQNELEIKSKAATDASNQKRFLVKAIVARGKIEGWLQDVTEKSKATEHLKFMAENDPLTKVFNRRGIAKIYGRAVHQIDYGKPLALAYLDLDRFKLINDLYGHVVGDEVLRQVCDRIRGVTSGSQQIGRIGGDEFVIVMPDTSMTSATWICRGIIDRICNGSFKIGEKAFDIGVSIGLIEISAGTDIKDALADADRACREAKDGHHDRLVVYEKNAKAFHDRVAELQLVESLGSAKTLDGLFLLMQPIMSLKAPLDSLNFEVLLRMRDPKGGVIPAGRIIGAAESSGRTGIIDSWVLSTTLAWLNTHYEQLKQTKFVCMNLNGASLNDEGFVQSAVAMLAANPRVAPLLCIEITESVALHDLKTTRRFIDRVRSYGVRVALDDFGAGYTSFSYLKELPADVLKIDGSFIVNMNEHPSNVSIVQAIVNLALNLGMKTIAEWAEDRATVKTLAEIGVDYVQGYAVSFPQEPDKILEADSAAGFIKDEDLKLMVESMQESSVGSGRQDVLNLVFPNSSKL